VRGEQPPNPYLDAEAVASYLARAEEAGTTVEDKPRDRSTGNANGRPRSPIFVPGQDLSDLERLPSRPRFGDERDAVDDLEIRLRLRAWRDLMGG
jgi:hypothetical protein